MDKVLLNKMIQKALKQYQAEVFILTADDFEHLYQHIIELKNANSSCDIYDLVQDEVYGFITDSPYF